MCTPGFCFRRATRPRTIPTPITAARADSACRSLASRAPEAEAAIGGMPQPLDRFAAFSARLAGAIVDPQVFQCFDAARRSAPRRMLAHVVDRKSTRLNSSHGYI